MELGTIWKGITRLSKRYTERVLVSLCSAFYSNSLLLSYHPVSRAFIGNPLFPLNSEWYEAYFKGSRGSFKAKASKVLH